MLQKVTFHAVAARGWTTACASNSLQNLLSMQDAVLGPHVPGRDPLLDALNTFVGTPGSPALRAWEQGLPNPTDPAGQLAGTTVRMQYSLYAANLPIL